MPLVALHDYSLGRRVFSVDFTLFRRIGSPWVDNEYKNDNLLIFVSRKWQWIIKEKMKMDEVVFRRINLP